MTINVISLPNSVKQYNGLQYHWKNLRVLAIYMYLRDVLPHFGFSYNKCVVLTF